MTPERLTEIEATAATFAGMVRFADIDAVHKCVTIVRTDVPDLCSAVRRAWAEIERLKEELAEETWKRR